MTRICPPTVLTWMVCEYFFRGPVASRKRVVSCTLQAVSVHVATLPLGKTVPLQHLQAPFFAGRSVIRGESHLCVEQDRRHRDLLC